MKKHPTNLIVDQLSGYLSRVANQSFRIFDAKIGDEWLFDKMHVEDNKSPILVIYGDNASGKSLFAHVLEAILRDKNCQVRSVAMRNRTSSGIQKAMIFGDEASQSTGETSIRVTTLAINSTIPSKPEEKLSPRVVILDEPDIGLSDKFARALGKYLSDSAKQFSNQAMVVITHNATIIDALKKHYDNPISYIGVETTMPYEEWKQNLGEASVEELLNLSEYAINRWRAISTALSEK